MGVIIASLIAASVGLPWLLKGVQMPAEPSHQAEIEAARIAAARAAITEVERAEHARVEAEGDADVHVEVAARIMDLYRRRIESRTLLSEDAAAAKRIDKLERELRLTALRAERTEILRLVRKRALGSESARKLIRELDLMETRYAG
jgi:CPA1 family monovalent cation:H+ antiporter